MLYLKLIQFNTDFELPFLGAAIQSHTEFLFVYMFVLENKLETQIHHYLRF